MSVFSKTSVASAATTSLFVLLWSSGAIVSKLGLAHASPFAVLLLRSALALAGLAYAYLSAATDFDISQVVDLVKGVHARIRKADFGG